MYILSAYESITKGSTGWTTVDLTGAPYSVPTTASFAVIRVIYKTGGIVEFRKPGSSYTVKTTTVTANSVIEAFVPCSSGTVDIYSSVVTGAALSLYLVGYTGQGEGSAFSEPIEISGAVNLDDTWNTVTLSAYIPSTAKWAVCQVASNIPAVDPGSYSTDTGIFMVRKYGTSLVRPTHSPNPGTIEVVNSRTNFVLAPVDSSGRMQTYAQAETGSYYSASNWRKLYLMGYLTIGSHNDSVTGASEADIGDTASWETKTATSTGVASVTSIFCYDTADFNGHTKVLDWRKNGSTDAINPTFTGPQDTLIIGAITPLDTSLQWQAYASDASYNAGTDYYKYYTIGWLDTEHLFEESVTVDDSILPDLHTRDEEEYLSVDDSLVVGDIYNDSANPSSLSIDDTLDPQKIFGAVVTESLLIDDTIDGLIVLAPGSGSATTPAFSGDGTLILNYYAYGSTSTYAFMSGGAFNDVGFIGVGAVDPPAFVTHDNDGLLGNLTSPEVDTPAFYTEGSYGYRGLVASEQVVTLPAFIVDGDQNPAGSMGVGAVTLPAFIGVGSSYFNYTGSGSSNLPAFIVGFQDPEIEGIYPSGAYLLYAVNISNGSVTMLPYNFNSMCVIDGVIYGATSTGIHAIGLEDTMNGQPIHGIIRKDGIDWGVPFEKVAADMYLRMKSRGSMEATAISEQTTGSVQFVDSINHLHGSKTDLPRGVKGRELGFIIRNLDGCDFEIAEIEMNVATSQNRRGRQVR